ncbi:MAG: hypothetical protein SGPRY_005214, partial [Prymnesium sp.]
MQSGQPMFYLRTIGMAHSFLHWTLIYSKFARLLLMTLVGTSAFLSAIGYVYFTTTPDSNQGQSFFDAATWILVANLIGSVHYFIRNKALWQHLVLRAQQQRALRTIQKETENCEQLLSNILPPHLIGSLSSFLQRLDPSGAVSIENIISPRLTSMRMAESPPMRAPQRGPRGANQMAPAKSLLAERYSDCSFLFAKIGGLSQLVNNNDAEPGTVIEVLQELFDQFDKLASIFSVQKAKDIGGRAVKVGEVGARQQGTESLGFEGKWGNEQGKGRKENAWQEARRERGAWAGGLGGAGLPDPDLLPQPTDRAVGLASYGFAIINVMDNVNLEISRKGIPITFSVGIASGYAIAGIIGHKTFQYDLCGDAVNTAARMCSYSVPGRVHVTDATYMLV